MLGLHPGAWPNVGQTTRHRRADPRKRTLRALSPVDVELAARKKRGTPTRTWHSTPGRARCRVAYHQVARRAGHDTVGIRALVGGVQTVVNDGPVGHDVGRRAELGVMDMDMTVDQSLAGGVRMLNASAQLPFEARLKGMEEAVECFDRVLHIDPRHSKAWCSKAWLSPRLAVFPTAARYRGD